MNEKWFEKPTRVFLLRHDRLQTDIRIHTNILKIGLLTLSLTVEIATGQTKTRQQDTLESTPIESFVACRTCCSRQNSARDHKKQKWNLSLDKKMISCWYLLSLRLAIKAAGSAQCLSNKEQCEGWQELNTVRAGLHSCCASACCIYNRPRRPPASITYRNIILNSYQSN